MTPFERLHPTIQHHVVNTLGWRELRPLQEASIDPLTSGKHALLLAPTAGGKTEAAFLPLLSMMATENWTGLSVIYVCPLKALLNNLHGRLERYCQWVGRTCALWHGDVLAAQRGRILANLPDCLLTTPESLEAILISVKTEHRHVFAGVRAIVVDELHAFAGDDRGWHLLSVLERLTHVAGREIQRVGLSATVGNPEALLGWLAGHCQGERKVVLIPPSSSAAKPEVRLDYVGSMENAARVISLLHNGEKRLVFCDSRSRVEQLGMLLRSVGVETYVSHSSLSADERKKAEQAFAEGGNCVIVATSTLELGIDVGDLDRVIQIDAPTSVASFLQRIGRTGRRSGSVRNCLFLALTGESLVQAAAILRLWESGYVEPIEPPSEPAHLFAQQIIALVLQERSIAQSDWPSWLGRLPAYREMPPETRSAIIEHLVGKNYLHADQGTWMVGNYAESELGRRHFSDLVSVFTSPPLFSVWHGRLQIGTVEETGIRGERGTIQTLALAGRAWRVTNVDWKRRRLDVQPEATEAKTRWLGGARSLSYAMCQAIKMILGEDAVYPFLSQRAAAELTEVRAEYAWLVSNHSGIREREDKGMEWWTFAGRRTNQWVCDVATSKHGVTSNCDDMRIRLDCNREKFAELKRTLLERPEVSPDAEAAGGKFFDLLPETVRARVLKNRTYDWGGISRLLQSQQ